jgi:hypothetical protein
MTPPSLFYGSSATPFWAISQDQAVDTPNPTTQLTNAAICPQGPWGGRQTKMWSEPDVTGGRRNEAKGVIRNVPSVNPRQLQQKLFTTPSAQKVVSMHKKTLHSSFRLYTVQSLTPQTILQKLCVSGCKRLVWLWMPSVKRQASRYEDWSLKAQITKYVKW